MLFRSIFHPKIGDKLNKGDLIAEIFTDKKKIIDDVKNKINSALTFSEKKVAKMKLIKEIII